MQRGSRCGFWQCCLYSWLWLCCIFGDFPHAAICYYCRASHTGDAIRAMYSSVSVGVVHVLCACAQVQSTVWRSCQPHLVTILPHLFVAFLRLFFFFFFLFLSLSFFLLLLLLLLLLRHILYGIFSHFVGPLTSWNRSYFRIFPQQRKLMGSSTQNSSGVHWCRRRVRFN